MNRGAARGVAAPYQNVMKVTGMVRDEGRVTTIERDTTVDGRVRNEYFVFMRNSEPIEPDLLAMLKALASPVRLAVLDHLKNPVAHFPPQVDGDPVTDGICADFLRDKLGIAPATASRHLTLLVDCGLLVATRKKGWTFYRRDEDAIARFIAALALGL